LASFSEFIGCILIYKQFQVFLIIEQSILGIASTIDLLNCHISKLIGFHSLWSSLSSQEVQEVAEDQLGDLQEENDRKCQNNQSSDDEGGLSSPKMVCNQPAPLSCAQARLKVSS